VFHLCAAFLLLVPRRWILNPSRQPNKPNKLKEWEEVLLTYSIVVAGNLLRILQELLLLLLPHALICMR
jgi:hypothetical protein